MSLRTPHNPSTIPWQVLSLQASRPAPRRLSVLRHRARCCPGVTHRSPAPRAPCAEPRGLPTGYPAQGTCVGHGAWDTLPAPGCRGTMLRPGHGPPVRHAGGVPGGPGEPSQAKCGEEGSRREPAQPEGLGVCRARCVLGGPGGTYPAPVPTQRGAGRPAEARARSACAAPRFSPPRAAGTACGTGRRGGVRRGLRAPAELSGGWDAERRWGSQAQGMH